MSKYFFGWRVKNYDTATVIFQYGRLDCKTSIHLMNLHNKIFLVPGGPEITSDVCRPRGTE